MKVEPKKEPVEKPVAKPPVKDPVKEPVKEQAKEPVPAPTPKPKAEVKPPEVKPKNKISLTDLQPAKVRPKTQAELEAKQQAEEKAQQQAEAKAFEQRVAQVAQTLRSGFSQGTAIEVHGTGGAAYADYASLVRAIYDDAWIVTDNVPDDNSTATVRVKIARDGDVIEAVMIKRSGNAALDHTVELTLRKVKFVQRFPPGMRDPHRTFTINFNLKGKRSIG